MKNKEKNFSSNKLKKWLSANKFLLSLLIITLFCCTGVFAASTSTDYDFGANKVLEVVIKFLTSKWVIGLVIALLAFEIILFITAGRSDNQAWKKFVPIILGTGLFLAAPKITGYFINNDSLTTTQTDAMNLMGTGTK